MVFVVGFLLVLVVGGYIVYPLCAKDLGQRRGENTDEYERIGEEIEQEILALRQYPDKTGS